MIWGFALQQFNYDASYAPHIRSRCRTQLFNDLRRHYMPVISLSVIRHTSAKLTPVRAPDDCAVTNLSSGNSKIGQFHGSILIGENVGTFDVTMYHTLVVQVNQAVEHLGNVYRDQVFWKFSEPLANIM